ncbi:hypothetical protein [Archangium lansingense]|uniref:Zinc-finger domain-containing protein n=1 Tax=Archangium lansingense TaxID=2995310 RepID=A0ABT4AD42_9BACT|nr:hypothetical protein [Archangium lansinium]MCY1079592.1 hypothetical protein [Archangium lansinium]
MRENNNGNQKESCASHQQTLIDVSFADKHGPPAFLKHIEECAACAAELEENRQLLTACEKGTLPKADVEFVDRVMAAVTASSEPQPPVLQVRPTGFGPQSVAGPRQPALESHPHGRYRFRLESVRLSVWFSCSIMLLLCLSLGSERGFSNAVRLVEQLEIVGASQGSLSTSVAVSSLEDAEDATMSSGVQMHPVPHPSAPRMIHPQPDTGIHPNIRKADVRMRARKLELPVAAARKQGVACETADCGP